MIRDTLELANFKILRACSSLVLLKTGSGAGLGFARKNLDVRVLIEGYVPIRPGLFGRTVA